VRTCGAGPLAATSLPEAQGTLPIVIREPAERGRHVVALCLEHAHPVVVIGRLRLVSAASTSSRRNTWRGGLGLAAGLKLLGAVSVLLEVACCTPGHPCADPVQRTGISVTP
jgi:hypothetical protein